ncbi:hypothetical protein CHARACLAT_010588 [Characodon lateralis]|uniref:Uncharacterized protein n=1 Tax=Characodon lateralis TaxID=208331 RepID=A0ABU7DQL6_9TELE|nr:hypothetical protein [Characodon lateralis]
MCNVIHRTSAFQEQQHSTHGQPKQPQPELCGAAVNKTLSSQQSEGSPQIKVGSISSTLCWDWQYYYPHLTN